jgi:hypothetical protein
MWLWSTLACIGEAFDDEQCHEHEICGIVASIRKPNDKISLWTRTALTADLQKRIGY